MTLADLSWVTPPHHRRLVGKVLAELDRDARVTGVLLAGSLARGDALPGSDVDLVVLVADGVPTEFRAERRDGTLIERSYLNEAVAREQLAAQPMRIYTHLDGRTLRDDTGGLLRLTAQARGQLATYRISPKERADLVTGCAARRTRFARLRRRAICCEPPTGPARPPGSCWKGCGRRITGQCHPAAASGHTWTI